MKINDTYSSFPETPTLESLRDYYSKHNDVFDFYFQLHCKNTDERLKQAIEKYPGDWERIGKVHGQIHSLVEDVVQGYKKEYQLEFPITVNLIVGAYGSNGYTNHQIIPDITLAMEQLTDDEEPLKVLIAHEFGHAAHNSITAKHEMNWSHVQWTDLYTPLLQEGAAIHFSRQIVPDLKESVYFSFKNTEDEWLKFAKENKQEIIQVFARDMLSEKTRQEKYKEWFSIRGGETFGYSRLAYFVADCMFQEFVEEIGELQTLLLWKNENYLEIIEEWLRKHTE